MKPIKQILMERDGMTSNEANTLIAEAKASLESYIAIGNLIDAENICEEFFGLEPDYLDELIEP